MKYLQRKYLTRVWYSLKHEYIFIESLEMQNFSDFALCLCNKF